LAGAGQEDQFLLGLAELTALTDRIRFSGLLPARVVAVAVEAITPLVKAVLLAVLAVAAACGIVVVRLVLLGREATEAQACWVGLPLRNILVRAAVRLAMHQAHLAQLLAAAEMV